MNVNSKQMSGVSVFTRSGRLLGRLVSMDFDADTGHLVAIHVSSGLVKGLLANELVIAWSDVMEMTMEKVVVADASVPAGAILPALA